MLSIGEFSRACQVTIKTLRHYDKIDLLKPAYIDEQSGYRYYETEQVSQLLLIQRLKRYGFSLAEIQQLLFTKDKCLLAAKLSAQKNILEQQLAQVSVIMYELEQHLADFERTGDIMSYQNKYQIVLKETGDLAVVGCRQQMSVDDFGQAYGKLFERVAREHCQPTGPAVVWNEGVWVRRGESRCLYLHVRGNASPPEVLLWKWNLWHTGLFSEPLVPGLLRTNACR